MKTNLTRKEGEFLKAYLANKPLYECAKRYGSKGKDRESLTSRGCQILGNLSIDPREILDLNGVTDQAATKPLIDGLKATRTLIATFQGHIKDKIDIDDHPTRGKFLEIYHRLRGNFIDKLELAGKDGGDIILAFKSTKGKNKRVIGLD